MSLQAQYTASLDTSFRQRCAVALATAAVAIQSEAHGGANQPTDAQHLIRKSWSTQVIASPIAAGERYAATIMTNPSLATQADNPGAIPDGDIAYTVNSMVDAMAGA